MALVRNPNTLTSMREVLQQQSAMDPNQDQVVLVAECNPKLLKNCNVFGTNTATNSTSATMLTADTSRETYIVAAMLNVIKDVTSTSTASNINVVVDGATRSILRMPGITLTVQDRGVALTFSPPIKIDKGSLVTVTNGTSVANISASGCCIGYLLDSQ